MNVIEVKGIRKVFGGLTAVDGVTFNVQEGQLKSIIGPNGAGKSTVLNMLSGVFKPTEGEILISGTPASRLEAYQVAKLGVSRTFQNVQLFANMTVLENVMVGRHCRTKQGLLASALRFPSQVREEYKIAQESLDKLKLVGLADKAEYPSDSLSFGQQRQLEIARAMASEPKVLLLDEPASGLSSHETEELSELLRRIIESNVTVVLVDHDMQFVMDISDEILVLDHGQKISEGTPSQVQEDPKVIAAYLGEEV